MKTFIVHIQDRLYRRVYKDKLNNLIMDYVSVGNVIPIIVEGEYIGY